MKLQIDVPPELWLDLQIFDREQWSELLTAAIRSRLDAIANAERLTDLQDLFPDIDFAAHALEPLLEGPSPEPSSAPKAIAIPAAGPTTAGVRVSDPQRDCRAESRASQPPSRQEMRLQHQKQMERKKLALALYDEAFARGDVPSRATLPELHPSQAYKLAIGLLRHALKNMPSLEHVRRDRSMQLEVVMKSGFAFKQTPAGIEISGKRLKANIVLSSRHSSEVLPSILKLWYRYAVRSGRPSS